MHRRLMAAILGITLVLPFPVLADKIQEDPNAVQMTADLLVARPLGLAMFGIGTAVYVVTLPFSLIGGNAGDAGSKLVVEPAKEVFVRCLGCKNPGRKEKVRER